MALMQRLEMRQGQSLVMTPQLLQAIKLLQLSHLDLAAYVEAELERNPLLERSEPDASEDAPGEDGLSEGAGGLLEGEADSFESETGGEPEPWLGQEAQTPDIEGTLDTPIENVFPDAAAA